MQPHVRAATELAWWFRSHLVEELGKPAEVMDVPAFEGRTGREVDLALLARLDGEFPSAAARGPAPFNLFREWVRRNDFLGGYDGYAYAAYNTIFMERLSCLAAWSEASRARFHDVALAVFRQIDTRRAGFSVSFFLRVENNMRELVRERLVALPDLDHEAAWAVVYRQSVEYQETINHFFERLLEEAYQESERLLLNILPPSVSEELKRTGRVRPVSAPAATVLFTDFVGFTAFADGLDPEVLVAELDECFSRFDEISDAHGVERIKTIGDAYMGVAGVPVPRATHVEDAVRAALAMRDAVAELRAGRGDRPFFGVRVGVHTGPLTAGVIGRRKFAWDVWGDTVNTASRMESAGEAGRVNVSRAVADALGAGFRLEPRGRRPVKGKGELEMFFVEPA